VWVRRTFSYGGWEDSLWGRFLINVGQGVLVDSDRIFVAPIVDNLGSYFRQQFLNSKQGR